MPRLNHGCDLPLITIIADESAFRGMRMRTVMPLAGFSQRSGKVTESGSFPGAACFFCGCIRSRRRVSLAKGVRRLLWSGCS